MRILISADVEGASGIVSRRERGREEGGAATPDLERTRRALTGDINAAVEGAMEAGAQSFVVHDCRGPGRGNVLLEELHPAVEVVQGRPVACYEEADLGRGYDGAFMVAMPPRVGEAAIFSRIAAWSLVREVRLNGEPVGEAELTAALAGAYGIPTVLVTGDDRVCRDVQRWSAGQVEAAVVKYSLTRRAARCLPLIEARERIRSAAARAVRRLKGAKPLAFAAPMTLQVEFADPEVARYVSWMPGVDCDGECTVSYRDGDFRRLYRALVAMFSVATSPLDP